MAEDIEHEPLAYIVMNRGQPDEVVRSIPVSTLYELILEGRNRLRQLKDQAVGDEFRQYFAEHLQTAVMVQIDLEPVFGELRNRNLLGMFAKRSTKNVR